MFERMEVATINQEKENKALKTAYKFNLTFHDSSYIIEANENNKVPSNWRQQTFVKGAESLGVETRSSNTVMNDQ